jgi:hypothetical protein
MDERHCYENMKYKIRVMQGAPFDAFYYCSVYLARKRKTRSSYSSFTSSPSSSTFSSTYNVHSVQINSIPDIFRYCWESYVELLSDNYGQNKRKK